METSGHAGGQSSRDRVLRALSLQQPDRTPVDLWASAGMRAKLERELGRPFETLLDAYDIDLRYIEGPAYIGPPLRTFPDGTEADLWGVRRRRVTVTMADGGVEASSLKAEFGDRLAFHGGLSIQQTLPFGTPEAVRSEVAARVRALSPGGGYILGPAHNIQADTPIDNVMALLEAYQNLT